MEPEEKQLLRTEIAGIVRKVSSHAGSLHGGSTEAGQSPQHHSNGGRV